MASDVFCALCTSTQGPFVTRPYGRNDSLVQVCKACDEEHPRQGGYSFGCGLADPTGGHRVRGRKAR